MAILYMQHAADESVAEAQRVDEGSKTHAPAGALLQVISTTADRSCLGLGTDLQTFALHTARLDPAVHCVVAVTMAFNFKAEVHGTLEAYVGRQAREVDFDPVFPFHTRVGAKIRRVAHVYSPKDKESQFVGVLVAFDVSDPHTGTPAPAAEPLAAALGEG